MIFRWRPSLRGTHVWIEVFAKPSPDSLTFANVGQLRLLIDEWGALRQMLIRAGGDERPWADIDLEATED